jgi:cytochrome c oxidase subunit 3
MLVTVAVFGLSGRVGMKQSGRIEVLSMYWHFVDAVWVVVFTVVYVLGR